MTTNKSERVSGGLKNTPLPNKRSCEPRKAGSF